MRRKTRDRHRRGVDFRTVALGLVVALVAAEVRNVWTLFVDLDHLAWSVLRPWFEAAGLGPRWLHVPLLGFRCGFWLFTIALCAGLFAAPDLETVTWGHVNWYLAVLLILATIAAVWAIVGGSLMGLYFVRWLWL